MQMNEGWKVQFNLQKIHQGRHLDCTNNCIFSFTNKWDQPLATCSFHWFCKLYVRLKSGYDGPFQIAVDGIMKFCLRDLLGQKQRSTFFRFLNVIALLCKDSVSKDDIPALCEELNVALALVERDFPVSMQVNFSYWCTYRIKKCL